ncbi:MAG TPA: type II toxin-antitoxin system Phd/YefM family antitoxin [Solirubrobacterales bacterium]|nr:type II toxin-antitoxin system Phd/YefM family antitoxin [Solirubrobacterales bacterium]
MASFSISEARGSLAEVVELSQSEAVFLERHGQKAAVMVSPERFERMMDALEEIEDEIAFDAAMAEEGENIPWAEAKTDLGWK